MHLLLMAAAAAALTGYGKPRPFEWGVNGHPMAQVGYRDVPIAAQLDLVAQLGARWYRCDWSQEGFEKDLARHEELAREAAHRGLRILPVIFPSVGARSDADPAAIRKASFEFAKAVAAHFRGKVTHYELDNELDCVAMIHKGEVDRNGAEWKWGDADGDKPEQFEEKRYAKVRAEMQGLSEGIRAGDPSARTIVDTAGWLHTGLFERLVREDKVPFDILGWHWYSEMGDMTKVRGSIDMIARLKAYGKPTWITEIDRRDGSKGGKQQEHAEYLSSVARQMAVHPDIAAFFVYELLDEPYFGADNPESHYGLVELRQGAGGKWELGAKKAAFTALRDTLRQIREAAAARP